MCLTSLWRRGKKTLKGLNLEIETYLDGLNGEGYCFVFLAVDPDFQVQPYKGYFCTFSKKSLLGWEPVVGTCTYFVYFVYNVKQ